MRFGSAAPMKRVSSIRSREDFSREQEREALRDRRWRRRRSMILTTLLVVLAATSSIRFESLRDEALDSIFNALASRADNASQRVVPRRPREHPRQDSNLGPSD